jgi:hypothetical protein
MQTSVSAGRYSQHSFHISFYVSRAPEDHQIEVDKLIPALTGASQLVKLANSQLTKGTFDASLLIDASFKDRCFSIDFNLILSATESLLSTTGVRTAKELLEWVGLLCGPVGLLSLIKFLAWKNGRKIERREKIPAKDEEAASYKIYVFGDSNTVTVNRDILQMAETPKISQAVKQLLSPITDDKFDEVKIASDKDNQVTLHADEVKSIVKSCDTTISGDETDESIETDNVWLSIYSPVFDLKAKKWKFKMGKDKITADISRTRMAEEAFDRGGVGVGDSYNVTLETKFNNTKKSSTSKAYSILKVNKFIEGERQSRFF